jgi:hypothetical protein
MHAAALRTAQSIRFLVSCWRGDEPLTRSMENGACWVGVELVITIEFVIDLALSPRYESCQSRRKQSIGPAVSHARASSRRGPTVLVSIPGGYRHSREGCRFRERGLNHQRTILFSSLPLCVKKPQSQVSLLENAWRMDAPNSNSVKMDGLSLREKRESNFDDWSWFSRPRTVVYFN